MTTINQQEPVFWSKPLRVERKFMGRGIGKVFLIHFFFWSPINPIILFLDWVHQVCCTSWCFVHVLALSKTEITTLTSQNSPSSYNASSLKGSKNGCLTMTPVKNYQVNSCLKFHMIRESERGTSALRLIGCLHCEKCQTRYECGSNPYAWHN